MHVRLRRLKRFVHVAKPASRLQRGSWNVLPLKFLHVEVGHYRTELATHTINYLVELVAVNMSSRKPAGIELSRLPGTRWRCGREPPAWSPSWIAWRRRKAHHQVARLQHKPDERLEEILRQITDVWFLLSDIRPEHLGKMFRLIVGFMDLRQAGGRSTWQLAPQNTGRQPSNQAS